MVKYIFVTGGVLSSVGKGILTSSIGKMLQARGLKPTVVKIDPYVNIDAGTMNPYMHGEVFVTDDGGETDLDLGWYERFLDLSLKQENNLTTGTIYRSVIEKERHGDFLGRCVQIVPHITNEIKNRIRNAAKMVNAEIVLTEVGGTVGDIEGLPFLEAIRQMRVEEGYENTLYVHVALVPILDVTGEMKTKPLQHSVNELRRIGIQPDTIVARSPQMIDAEALRKIALFGTIPESAVFCSYNAETVYQVPLILDKQGMGDFICQRLGFKCEGKDFSQWQVFVDGMVNPEHEVKIALVGKYAGLSDSYVSMTEALTAWRCSMQNQSMHFLFRSRKIRTRTPMHKRPIKLRRRLRSLRFWSKRHRRQNSCCKVCPRKRHTVSGDMLWFPVGGYRVCPKRLRLKRRQQHRNQP